MKKVSILLVLFCSLLVGSVIAQRTWTPEDIAKAKEKRSTTLVDSLAIPKVNADSVTSIEFSTRMSMGELRKEGLDRDAMIAKMRALQQQKNDAIQKILSADAYTKYVDMEKRNREKMRNRMGGGFGRQDNN